MRSRILLLTVLCTVPLAAQPAPAPAPAPSPLPATPVASPPANKPAEESILPLQIPGYDLRVLDVRKEVTVNVAGTWARASLPVFIYVPTTAANSHGPALELLRNAGEDLLALSRTREWSAADLRRVLVTLDSGIGKLESKP